MSSKSNLPATIPFVACRQARSQFTAGQEVASSSLTRYSVWEDWNTIRQTKQYYYLLIQTSYNEGNNEHHAHNVYRVRVEALEPLLEKVSLNELAEGLAQYSDNGDALVRRLA